MIKQLCCAVAIFAAGPLFAESTYPILANQAITLISAQSLIQNDCVNQALGWKRCTILSKVESSIDRTALAPGYLLSGRTGISVEGDFSGLGSNFRLEVDGFQYALQDKGLATLVPLAPGTNKIPAVKIVAVSSGKQTIDKTNKADIFSVKLVLDNTGYLVKVLADLPTLKTDAESARNSYDSTKSLNAMLKLSVPEIETLKETLTGRPKDDFGTCSTMADGTPDLLDKETCQIYRVLNNFLLGRPTGIDDKAEELALADFSAKVFQFSDAIGVLQNGLKAVDKSYLDAVKDLLEYVKQEQGS